MKLSRITLLLLLLFFSKSFSQNDCTDAIIVCGNAGFSGLTATGVGSQELGAGVTCGSQENNSIWMRLNIQQTGTLGFTLKPTSSNLEVDFDFFIFGPNSTCGSLGTTIRCSTTNPEAAGATNNWTGLNATEIDDSEGPGGAGNSFLKQLDVIAGQTYFLVIDRPIGSSNFSIEWNGTAKFFDPPVLSLPGGGAALNLKKCDADANQNQSTAFDFTANTNSIINGQSDVVVTYHLNENDAILGENAIPNPASFENTTNPQDIFFRVENTLTGCFIDDKFRIEIENFAVIPTDRAEFCDDAADGDETNGLRTFTMNEVTTKILAGVDTTGLTISYYEDVADAFPENNPIGTTFTNTIPFQHSIYMKVKNASGCYEIKEIILVVNPLPSRKNISLVQCDTDLNPDGRTLFNLNQASAELSNFDSNFSVAYFKNAADEANNQNAITQFVNQTNPQNIIARVTNLTTGCSSTSNVSLSVNVTPSQNVLLTECDSMDSEDGIATFDLTESNLITAPQTVVFYETVSDALLEQNAIANFTAYDNQVAYNDTVYARIENGNDCAGISEVRLEVYRLPNIDPESDNDDYVCTNAPNEFITINAGMITGQTLNYTYIWRLDGEIFPKISYSIQLNQAGTYTVEVIDKVTACRKIRTILVQASSDAVVDSVEVEDVTVENNTVTITLTPGSIGDYEYSFGDVDGNYQSSNVFENVPSGIYDVFIRDKHGCGTTIQKVVIIGLPKFFTPNGDGVNDYWKVDGVDAVFNNTTKIYIFNRDGKLVKEVASRDATGWDGTLNGRPLPADDYWYMINLADGRQVKGHFALKR